MKKPHLAQDAKDLTKLPYPVAVLPKVDGVRLLTRQDSSAVGRSFKPYKNKRLTEFFSNPLFAGFDGEVIATSANDPDVCRLTTSLVNTIKGDLPNEYMVFDYLTEKTMEYGFIDRYKSAQEWLEKNSLLFGKLPVNIYISDLTIMHSPEEIDAYYNSLLEDNYEGVIVRTLNGKHKNGRSTPTGDYLRLKPTGDSEGILVSVEDTFENQNEAKINALGHTERSSHKENKVAKGMIGAIWLKDIHTDEIVKVGAGKMTHEQRKYFWENQEEFATYIHKYAFLATGKKDAPRHARWIGFRALEDISK